MKFSSNDSQTKSALVKRSVHFAGRQTSISLEDQFWEALLEIAKERGATAKILIQEIDKERTADNLSSAVRLFVLDHYVKRCA